jgi:hypothetical protein
MIFMGIERRLNNRVIETLSMAFLLIDKTVAGVLDAQDVLKFRDGLVVDFSSTGISMKTWDLIDRWVPFLNSGDLLVGVQIQFADEARPVYAITKVMWVKKIPPQKKYFMLGLKFMNISTLDLVKVRKYVIGSNTQVKK